jgi:BolA family transcriptional regulator, general stress-responsive regulator
MSVSETIRDKLARAFAPLDMEIVDESARHAGHAGAQPGGETHFRVTIVSAGFQGLSRLARQRAVNAVLADELRTRVHALSLVTQAPDEV